MRSKGNHIRRLDILLCLDVTDKDADYFYRSIRVNFLAHYHTVKAFLPGMLTKGRGTIVTVSSVLANYGAANLCECLALKRFLFSIEAHNASFFSLGRHLVNI